MAQFKGMLHLLHKRMANVAYPISKQEILEQIGDEIVKVDMEHYLSVREIIAPIRQETFSCAAEGGEPPSFYTDERMRDSLKTVRSKYRFQRVSFWYAMITHNKCRIKIIIDT